MFTRFHQRCIWFFIGIVLLLGVSTFITQPSTSKEILQSNGELIQLEPPGQAHLVRDINNNRIAQSYYDVVKLDGYLYFLSLAVHDYGPEITQLWKSDGTTGGTVLIKEFADYGEVLIRAGNKLFFRVKGSELWVSDGTTSGTHILKKFYPPSSINEMIAHQNMLYFRNSDGYLWKTDGTEAGTILVSDLSPEYLTSVQDKLFFAARDDAHGKELWISDGTTPGTQMVKDITPGGSTAFDCLVAVDDMLYFGANSKLWISDGTNAGTQLVKEIPYVCNEERPNGIDIEGILYFSSWVSNFGRELWKSDGTPSGTTLVKDINPGDFSSAPEYITNYNGTLIFSATLDSQRRMWRSDGSEEGTVEIMSFRYANRFKVVNNLVFFEADDGTHGGELWKSDGTTLGTSLVIDISPGSESTRIGNLFEYQNLLIFDVQNASIRGLWTSDGSEENTRTLFTRREGKDSYREEYTPIEGTLFFIGGNNEINNVGLWRSDATLRNTLMLSNFDWNGSIEPTSSSEYKGKLYFVKNSTEIWKSDGTSSGTGTFQSFMGQIHSLVNFKQHLYFFENLSTTRNRLYRSNGTRGGTTEIVEVRNSTENLYASGDFLYFTASWGSYLLRTDGTEAGTIILSGPNLRYPSDFTDVNGILFFSEGSPIQRLWKSNGFPAGTELVKVDEINGPNNPESLVNVNGILYFSAEDSSHGRELWRSDGTASGTYMVMDILPGTASSNPMMLHDFNGLLVFAADDGEHGVELWRSDGSDSGAWMIKDINLHGDSIFSTDRAGDHLRNQFIHFENQMFFAADDNTTGVELWVSDGTPEGTTLFQDIHPGPRGSYPIFHSIAEPNIYFDGYSNAAGWELWALPYTVDLRLDKSINPETPRVKQQLTYTLDISNSGLSVSNIELQDELPAILNNFTLASNHSQCTLQNSLLSCEFPELQAGENQSIIIETIPLVAGSVENTASIGSAEQDINLENNMDAVTSTILPPEISLPFMYASRCAGYYFDDFSNSNSGWPIGKDEDFQIGYRNNEYYMELGPGSISVSPGIYAERYIAEVDVRRTSGSDISLGIVFDIDDSYDEYYTYEIYPGGWYAVWYYSSSWGWTLLHSGSSSSIKPISESNHLVIEKRSDYLHVFANNTYLASLNVIELQGPKRLGIIGSNFENNMVELRFDNFKVCGATSTPEPVTSALRMVPITSQIVWRDLETRPELMLEP